MNLRFLALGLAVCGAANAAVIVRDAPPDRWKAIADRLYATVVQVQGIEARQIVARGTGVLIGDGLAVTTLHSVSVLRGTSSMVVREIRVLATHEGPLDAQVIDAVPELDLALLRLGGAGGALAGAALATDDPAVGDRMVAMGMADAEIAGIGVVVAGLDGDVLSLTSRRTLDSRFWGGPLFDAQGKLAGIQLTGGDATRAVTARVIRALSDRHRLPAGAR